MPSDTEQLSERYSQLSRGAKKVIDGGLLKIVDVFFVPTSLWRLGYTANKASLPRINGWLMLGLESLRGAAYISFMHNAHNQLFT